MKQKLSTENFCPLEHSEFNLKNRQIRELQSQADEAKGNVNDTHKKLLPVFGGLQSTGKIELSLKVEEKLRKRLKIKSAANRPNGDLSIGWREACRQMAEKKRLNLYLTLPSFWLTFNLN